MCVWCLVFGVRVRVRVCVRVRVRERVRVRVRVCVCMFSRLSLWRKRLCPCLIVLVP